MQGENINYPYQKYESLFVSLRSVLRDSDFFISVKSYQSRALPAIRV
ncbi:hypothetical protein SAMN06269250_0846 [Spirosoma fluviale]|uniref:Uncharacterized protein n=1 Tax=Spirosoma fluviale TaxID=1597977 RepID=A0A286F7L1_9BACT|nr:hypothetical protein SAMN06269250_0846 [Spirosoma fluviale]